MRFKDIINSTFSADSALDHADFHPVPKLCGGWSQTTHKSDAANFYRSKDNFGISNI
jgi:hypothetical protein